MSYEPTNWQTGDVVTSQKLNKLEQGVADAGGGGGFLVVNMTMTDTALTLDKTWQEIWDAVPSVLFMDASEEDKTVYMLYEQYIDQGVYLLDIGAGTRTISFQTASSSGYPSADMS